KRPFTVDLHCHALTRAVEALVADCPEKKAEPAQQLAASGEASVRHNREKMYPAVLPKLLDVKQRLADMDAMGVDVQVVSPSPNQYYYWAEPELAEKIVRLCNENISAMCAAHPERFAGLGNIALQHPDLACEQLERDVGRLGLRGVEISTHIAG